jgi:hypothetical protein
MSACISKVMESLTAQRLSAAAFRCGAMSRMQMGGIQDNLVTDALIYTLTPMSNVLKIPPGKARQIPPGSRPSILTHGIEEAFNNTNPKILVQIMQQRQMPSYLVKVTRAFTINRKIAFAFDGQPETPIHKLNPTRTTSFAYFICNSCQCIPRKSYYTIPLPNFIIVC